MFFNCIVAILASEAHHPQAIFISRGNFLPLLTQSSHPMRSEGLPRGYFNSSRNSLNRDSYGLTRDPFGPSGLSHRSDPFGLSGLNNRRPASTGFFDPANDMATDQNISGPSGIESNIPISEERMNTGHPLIFRRFEVFPLERRTYYPRRHVFSDSFEDAVKDKNKVEEEKTEEGNGWRVLFFLILMGVAALIGFYLGKINESRNYVRVPTPN